MCAPFTAPNTLPTRVYVAPARSSASMVFSKVGASGLATMASISDMWRSIAARNAGR